MLMSAKLTLLPSINPFRLTIRLDGRDRIRFSMPGMKARVRSKCPVPVIVPI
jgi:hypothetical protein